MWVSATCPLVTGILLRLTRDFLGKIFPVEEEVVKIGRIGVVAGNLHTPKVTPLIYMSSRGRASASPTLRPPIVHFRDRSRTHGSAPPPVEPSRRDTDH